MGYFHFMLTESEKQYLKDLVHQSIDSGLNDESPEMPKAPSEKLTREHGAFVTLKLDGHLRGCIGHVQGTGPINETIWEMARAAAFRDPRFAPLTREEFEKIEIEISILGPINMCSETEAIEIGRHGLIIQKGQKSGLLLPQVAKEWGWNKHEFLKQVCLKAGLPEDAWFKAGSNLFWFEAEIF